MPGEIEGGGVRKSEGGRDRKTEIEMGRDEDAKEDEWEVEKVGLRGRRRSAE